jgi:hypothetical protein
MNDGVLCVTENTLHSQFYFLPAKLGDVGDENDENFLQDISAVEKSCCVKWNATVLSDHCWNL